MKVKDIACIIEKKSPKDLKESYDNVGLMVGDSDKEVKKILLALDCTLDVIDEAIREEVDLIFTHHPLMFIKPKSITMDTLQGKKIIKLIKNDISVYSAHTNLDSAKDGVNNSLMKILGMDDSRIIDKSLSYDDSGIGRVADIEETTLDCLIEKIKSSLKIDKVRYTGNLNDKIRTVAVVNGSGQDYLEKVMECKADVLITGDTTYHYASDYSEMGLDIIDAGHFSTEWLPFLSSCKSIMNDINSIDETIIFKISESVRSPYNYK